MRRSRGKGVGKGVGVGAVKTVHTWNIVDVTMVIPRASFIKSERMCVRLHTLLMLPQ